MEKRAVIVTTEFRGVFFGYVKDDSKLPEKITLTDAKNCIYWSPETKGVFGLASAGPAEGSKIGPKIPELTVWKVTSVSECTPEAVENWQTKWN